MFGKNINFLMLKKNSDKLLVFKYEKNILVNYSSLNIKKIFVKIINFFYN